MAKMLKIIDGNFIEYEILKLVDEYDPILHTPTKELSFTDYDENSKPSYVAFSIAETLSKRDGALGLSANQCGLPYRMFAMNSGDKIWMFINPKIVWASETLSEYNEGCLSYPGLFLKPKRASSVEIEFQELGGNVMRQKFDGLTATIVQHEIDHLDGISFIKKVSPIKLAMAKDRVKSNIRKFKKMRKTG